MTTTCSHWWHLPIYITLSLTVTLMSISSPPPPPQQPPPTTTVSPTISAAATAVLRSHGYTTTATLLNLSPSLFFPNNITNITIFALHDNILSNLLNPSKTLKPLLLFHSVPSKFTHHSLLFTPFNSCLPTNLPTKHLTITRISRQNRTVEINNVRISHPDLFLDENVSIHGVLSPFTPLNKSGSDLDFIETLPCESFMGPPRSELWVRVVQVLSSNGYVSFAIGLNSVLESIIKDYPDLEKVTVFVPRDFGFVTGSDPFLDRVVRYHIVIGRYSYSELMALGNEAKMVTLLKGEMVEVNNGVVNGSRVLGINGVSLDSPDEFSNGFFVVHVISSHFELGGSANT